MKYEQIINSKWVVTRNEDYLFFRRKVWNEFAFQISTKRFQRWTDQQSIGGWLPVISNEEVPESILKIIKNKGLTF